MPPSFPEGRDGAAFSMTHSLVKVGSIQLTLRRLRRYITNEIYFRQCL